MDLTENHLNFAKAIKKYLLNESDILNLNKIDTKINPADITTKQDGMSAELFEQHTKALLGEMEILPLQVNNVVAHIMEVEGKPMVISILRHSSGALLGLIHNK